MKRTKTVLILICLICLIVTNIEARNIAQSKPNLSGNWTLDIARSNFGRLGSSQFKNAKMTLKISHREPELKINRSANMNGQSRNHNLTYFTDGRGENNPNILSNESMGSKTKWEGTKLISRSSSSISFNGQSMTLEAIEKRELSADGKTLTITNTISSPRGVDVIKLVFAKASA
jgi:hypothetical protein